MAGQFTMRKHDEGAGAVRIVVTGEIDHDVSEALSTFIANAAGQHGVQALLIDLDRVPLLAAAGIRCLLSGREAALRHGQTYQLVHVRREVVEALTAAGVAELQIAWDVPVSR